MSRCRVQLVSAGQALLNLSSDAVACFTMHLQKADFVRHETVIGSLVLDCCT